MERTHGANPRLPPPPHTLSWRGRTLVVYTLIIIHWGSAHCHWQGPSCSHYPKQPCYCFKSLCLKITPKKYLTDSLVPFACTFETVPELQLLGFPFFCQTCAFRCWGHINPRISEQHIYNIFSSRLIVLVRLINNKDRKSVQTFHLPPKSHLDYRDDFFCATTSSCTAESEILKFFFKHHSHYWPQWKHDMT